MTLPSCMHLVVDVSNHLTGDDINYGTVRCSEVLVDEQLKFVHVYFVEQGVSAMKKGRASMSKQAIGGSVFKLSFSSSMAEYSDNLVIEAIQSLKKSINTITIGTHTITLSPHSYFHPPSNQIPTYALQLQLSNMYVHHMHVS